MNIYKTINLLTGKLYVGKDVNDRKYYLGSGTYLKRAILKYGKNTFKKEIIEYCKTKAELKDKEIFWIKKLNTLIPNGYNITKGGDGGIGGPHFKNHKHTEQSKEKMRKAWDYDKNVTPERNKKISIAKTGIPRSSETKKKLSDLYTGKTFEERFGIEKAKEIKEKLSKLQLGKKKPKQSIAMKGRFIGEKSPMYGKHQSEKFKEQKRIYFLSDKNPGKNKSKETCLKISLAKTGKSTKLKGIPRKKIICPYCNKIGADIIMKRWHFNNCKYKK